VPTRRVRIFAASPGDVAAERDALEEVVAGLNQTLGRRLDLVLELVRWETHAWPGFGADAQDVINGEIAPYDVFVGIMWKRLGSPTTRAASGTVEEFERAYEGWRAHARPHLMFYFRRAPFYSERPEELEQFHSVLKFKQSLSERGGFLCEYTAVEDFKQHAHRHLYLHLSEAHPHSQSSPALDDGIFDVPAFVHTVERRAPLERLANLLEEAPIVSVEGLSGTGKTFLVADLLRRNAIGASTLWYDVPLGSTLDEMLALLSPRLPFNGSSTATRAKELVHHLVRENLRLVIDDFEGAATDTFGALLEAGSRHSPPTRVILISRSRVEMPLSLAVPCRLLLSGLERDEMSVMLTARRLPSTQSTWLSALGAKLDGLPFAVSLFATLVDEFGADPGELLTGTLVTNDRLRRWFAEISGALPFAARELLKVLSATVGPFDRDTVQMACRRAKAPDSQDTFACLQRAHLVEAHAVHHWRVHSLISTFCLEAAPAHELERIHSDFADHHLIGLTDETELVGADRFARGVMGCRHLQRAGRRTEAQALIARLAPTAKAEGHYETFSRLLEEELRHPAGRDRWIDYHYAHCCLITGRIATAALALRSALADASASAGNERLFLSLARLQAEVQLALGQPRDGLRTLEPAMAAVRGRVKAQVWAHARTAEALLRLELHEVTEPDAIARDLRAYAETRGDERAGAVALTLLGRIDLARGRASHARSTFARAVNGFQVTRDRRGTAWALSGLAEADLRARETAAAVRHAAAAIQIRAELDECSAEYLRFLRLFEDAREHIELWECASVVEREISRVAARLDSERARTEVSSS
jgi:hypothetical protein